MIFFFYRNYPYAPGATTISAFANLLALLSAVGAIACIGGFFTQNAKNVLLLLGGVALGALAVFLFLYVGRKLTDQIAEKETKKNLRTKARFAYNYCRQHPEAYETLKAENPDFAAKYTRDETTGKLVKIRA